MGKLFSGVGKIYAVTLIKSMHWVTKGMDSEEQGALISGLGCVDKIFTLEQMSEKMRGEE